MKLKIEKQGDFFCKYILTFFVRYFKTFHFIFSTESNVPESVAGENSQEISESDSSHSDTDGSQSDESTADADLESSVKYVLSFRPWKAPDRHVDTAIPVDLDSWSTSPVDFLSAFPHFVGDVLSFWWQQVPLVAVVFWVPWWFFSIHQLPM